MTYFTLKGFSGILMESLSRQNRIRPCRKIYGDTLHPPKYAGGNQDQLDKNGP